MLAFIPALHADKEGELSASIQMIADEGAWYFPFPADSFHIDKKWFCVVIGENRFSDKGIRVHLTNDEISVEGEVYYGAFRLVPFMQCRHNAY